MVNKTTQKQRIIIKEDDLLKRNAYQSEFRTIIQFFCFVSIFLKNNLNWTKLFAGIFYSYLIF